MKYPRIMAALMAECWAMEETKFLAMLDFLEFQFEGGKLSEVEIAAKVGKGVERATAKQEGAIALIPIHGALISRANLVGQNSAPPALSYDEIGAAFGQAVNDPAVKAIVLDVNSPGGHVAGADELSSAIYASRGTKPIIAHVNPNAASAAYWIATAADEMVVTSSGEVGSIGVLGVHIDDTDLREKLGVKRTILSAGKYKAELDGPLSDEARAYHQARVDESYSAFVKAVARNRNVSQTAVREGFGQGRMVMAQQAVRDGMADRIGTLAEVLTRLGAGQAAPASSGRRAFALEREKRALSL